MKSKESLSKSAIAAFKKASKAAKNIHENFKTLDCCGAQEVERLIAQIREELNELNQRFHEYNAYRNALETK